MRQHYQLFPTVAHSAGTRRGIAAPSRRNLPALVGACVVLSLAAGCASLPTAGELRQTRAVLPAAAPGVTADGRARFRQIFCRLAQGAGAPPEQRGEDCDQLLWRLVDEPRAPAAAPLPELDAQLQFFVIGGAFSDCFGEASVAYRDAVDRLAARGYRIGHLAINSRSSASHNAGMIAEGLARAPAGPVVLLGYSKGAVDILQFLADSPALAERVAAVVSAAGPIFGSEIAERGDWAYDTFLAQAFSGRCDPGDGGVLDSLQPQLRREWLARHPLPRSVRYYSLLAFTTRDHMARALVPSWEILAASDPRNDGQLTLEEGTWPGSTLLGYANADHWGVAIDIEEELEFLAERPDERRYPRAVLLEAALRYVSEDLRRAGPAPTLRQAHR